MTTRVRALTARVALCALWSALVIGLFAPSSSIAELHDDFNINTFIQETQKQTPDPDRVTLAWWLPEEFWEWSLTQNQAVSDQGMEEFLEVLRPYLLVVVLDGRIGPLGGITFVGPKELSASVAVVDATGQRYLPLDDDRISPDARNLASMMTPVLANMLGPMGENMAFVYFHALTSDGAPIATTATTGTFSVVVAEQVFEWSTPLGSVLPSKVCPADGQALSGAWSYCPWHGEELVAKDSQENK